MEGLLVGAAPQEEGEQQISLADITSFLNDSAETEFTGNYGDALPRCLTHASQNGLSTLQSVPHSAQSYLNGPSASSTSSCYGLAPSRPSTFAQPSAAGDHVLRHAPIPPLPEAPQSVLMMPSAPREAHMGESAEEGEVDDGDGTAASAGGDKGMSHVCSWPGCGKGFTSRWSLERHVRNHEAATSGEQEQPDSFVERRLRERLRSVKQALEKTREKLSQHSRQQLQADAELRDATLASQQQKAEMQMLARQAEAFAAQLPPAVVQRLIAGCGGGAEVGSASACVRLTDGVAGAANGMVAPPSASDLLGSR